MNKRQAQYLLSLLISVLLALLVGALIMALSGYDPVVGYRALWNGVFLSERTMGDALAKAMTLALTGLAMAVAAKAGIFNVGGEGQLYLGAIASAVVGGVLLVGVSPWIAIPLCLLAAMAAGGLYAFIPGWLKVRLGVNEVITTILLNSAALYFCTFLVNGPFKTTERGISAGTPKLAAEFGFQRLIRLSNVTEAIFLAALIAVACWFILSRTSLGYEMKMTGQNKRFARAMGIRVDQLALGAMVVSGMICGLVGMFEVFGVQKRYVDSISSGFYFDGMLVAMIMRYEPIGIVLMALFFGVLKIGSLGMEKVGIPAETTLIIQSVIIFFMAAENGIMERLQNRRAVRKTSQTVKKA